MNLSITKRQKEMLSESIRQLSEQLEEVTQKSTNAITLLEQKRIAQEVEFQEEKKKN